MRGLFSGVPPLQPSSFTSLSFIIAFTCIGICDGKYPATAGTVHTTLHADIERASKLITK